jgi:phosphatidylethanolamine/phosphatidyl-N-methylethanolamine N-methyltransferase
MRLKPSKVTLPSRRYFIPASLTRCFVQMRRVSGERCRATIDLDSILKAYRRYAPAYDFVFGPVFQLGRSMTATRVNELDSKSILEVGVGTGLSLSRYDSQRKIVGIDVSSEMLAIAKRRVESRGLRNVTALAEMDGERLAFRDGQFDAVVAMHVMSVTPNPRRCLAEMQRVCSSGGNILICNHFVKPREKSISPLLQPLSRQLGWRPNFSLPELLEDSRLEVATINPVPPFGFFDLIVLRNP